MQQMWSPLPSSLSYTEEKKKEPSSLSFHGQVLV